MPVAEAVNHAALTYRRNGELLTKSLARLSREEWLRQPGELSNHLLWILGHVLSTRAAALRLLGVSWSKPWLPLFGRGSKLVNADQYPPIDDMNAAWQESVALLNDTLEKASAATLASPAPEKIPSFDGTLGGTIDFLAYHEAGHVGQAAYLRTWLGHDGISG